jgi:hypothetical protein
MAVRIEKDMPFLLPASPGESEFESVDWIGVKQGGNRSRESLAVYRNRADDFRSDRQRIVAPGYSMNNQMFRKGLTCGQLEQMRNKSKAQYM